MIDYWTLTKDFKQGDTVQRFVPGLGGSSLSPFAGTVTAVHRGLGVVDVQWPYGNERMFPDDIVRVDAKVVGLLPPSLSATYDLPTAGSKTAGRAEWRTSALPVDFYHTLAQYWVKGAGEVEAYDCAWRKYAGIDDDLVKAQVAKFYLVSANLTKLRVRQHVARTAAYWTAQNRQYRVTKTELDANKPKCPRCGGWLRRVTYQMDEGNRHRLFACPQDLFLIKTDHMLGPDGQAVCW